MSTERPQISAPKAWHYPTATTRTLPNGLRVWSFHLPGQHVVSAIMVLDIPLALEPRELEGVATLALRTSDEGTAAHPGEQIIDALESVGAAFEGSASASATICSLDVPGTRLAAALPLFAEIVRTPLNDDSDVERHVALRLGEIDQTFVSPPSLAALAVRQVLFDASSREARAQGGARASVEQVTGEQVRAFRAAHWRPEGATLILAGDLRGVDADALVDEAFAGWQGAAEQPRHLAPAPGGRATTREGRRVVHLVDVPGAVQTEIRISGLGVDRASNDFAPLQIASTAMGGAFGSRLNRHLREEKGFTYGVHFSVAPARVGGTWAVSTSVRTEVSAEALTDALAIMALDEQFTTEEVADAVNQQLGIAPLRYDTAGAIASQAATLAAAGWESDFVNLHFTRVARVTPQTASEAYRRIVREENAHIILVGDAAVLRGQLEAAGFAVEDLVVTGN